MRGTGLFGDKALDPAKLLPATITPSYGLYGDYVGGILGTLISAVTLIVVWLTWRATSKAQRVQGVLAVVAEMLKTHDAVAGSGENSFWSRSGTPSAMLREFSAVYEQTRAVVPEDTIWSTGDRIDIAYTFTFYGLSSNATDALSSYGEDRIRRVSNAVSELRYREGRYKGLFKGHQTTVSQYMRNLFNIYSFIAGSAISSKDKYAISKIVRAKLSNYEQAVLALNIMSHLGAEWEYRGLVEKFKPFANIPKRFYGFDDGFSLKDRFPSLEFEWEGEAGRRPRYFPIRLGRMSLTLAIY